MKALLTVILAIASFQIAYAVPRFKQPRIKIKSYITQGSAKEIRGKFLLINAYLPAKESGLLTLKIHNKTGFHIGLIEFDLSSLKDKGHITLEGLNFREHKIQRNMLQTVQGLILRDFLIVDKNANRRYPKVIVQFIKNSPKN